MRVLIACEFSGTVRDAFIAAGHDAMSCDLLPSERPGPHAQDDIFHVLADAPWRWDLMIAHPPCTYLTNAGVRHLHDHVTSKNGNRALLFGDARRHAMVEAAEFFNALRAAPIERIAIENPIPHKYAREVIDYYDQCVQPWQFGDGVSKSVCLWLKGLPKLEPTHHPGPNFFWPEQPTERRHLVHRMPPSNDRSKKRSVFFPGIAAAMATQWGFTDKSTSQ